MSDFLRAAVGLFAAIAPAGAAPVFLAMIPDARQRASLAALSCVVALGVLAAFTFAGEPMLDWLDVSAENFQLAAAVIMLPQALHLMWNGQSLAQPEPAAYGPLPTWLVPGVLPLLAGPASLAASVTYGTRFGEGTAIGAVALVLAVSAAWIIGAERLERLIGRVGVQTLARLSGALLAVIAVEMAVDGVQSV